MDIEKLDVQVNAFRIVDNNNTCFLDFMDYNADNNEAVVIHRLKMNKCVLSSMCGFLEKILENK